MQTPDPDSVQHHIQRAAVHLETLQASHGFDDLRPFAQMVGDARIVALGEATHGTREFFLLKHRLIEFLVAELGFTIFALEANWSESEIVNEYVMTGHDDPAAALAGLRFWTWDTEEVLALLEWMRAWNAGHGPDRQVRFAGIDAQFTSHAVARLRDYLGTVDPAYDDAIGPTLERIAALDLYGEHGDDEIERHFSEVTRELSARLAENEDLYTSRSSARAWRDARHHVRILRQIDEQRHAPDGAAQFASRDRAMADNVDYVLKDGDLGDRVIVWAHNGHVTRNSHGLFAPDVMTMGKHLAERHGDRYLAVGFAFGTGSFQAIVDADEDTARLEEIDVGTPRSGSLNQIFLNVSQSPGFLLDTRGQTGELVTWLHQEQRTREVGAVFTSETEMYAQVLPTSRYDVLAFVRDTTRARPTATGHRPRRGTVDSG